MWACAAVALALALAGVYGTFWCAVRRRTREIGVRLALGATPRQILRVVLGSSARLTLAGVAPGLSLAIAGTRVLKSLLYDVSPTDPSTFVVAAAFLAAAALTAT